MPPPRIARSKTWFGNGLGKARSNVGGMNGWIFIVIIGLGRMAGVELAFSKGFKGYLN
jgi:hypothetical protein